jgi:phage tail sheath protein FI
MSNPTVGLTITRDDSDPRPAVGSDMSVIGLIGPMSDGAEGIPINAPTAFNSTDKATLAALGTNNFIADAVRGINDQLGERQTAARIVLVRTPASASNVAATARDENIASIVGDSLAGTGLNAFLSAGSSLGRIPRLIAAPGFTGYQSASNVANPVCAALPSILDRLLAHAVVDGPATSRQAALDWRETIQSDRIIPVDPAVSVINAAGATITRPASARILGIGVRRDHEKGGKPFHSWANQPVRGIIGPSRPIGFSLTDGATEGQELLAANIGVILRGEGGVEDAIASGGFVYVGTDNAGEDDLWRFYNVMRGRDYIHLLYLKTLRFYLGRFNISLQTLQSIANTMNFALRDLKASNDILGYDQVRFPTDLNPAESLRMGEITVKFNAEEAPVLRRINILSGRYRAALDDMIKGLSSQLDSAAA